MTSVTFTAVDRLLTSGRHTGWVSWAESRTRGTTRERARDDAMTEIRDDVIGEALALIDKGLGDMLHRELVSTDEVADLLLDVRTLLSAPDVACAADEVAVGS
jgi:hypothetical protein